MLKEDEEIGEKKELLNSPWDGRWSWSQQEEDQKEPRSEWWERDGKGGGMELIQLIRWIRTLKLEIRKISIDIVALDIFVDILFLWLNQFV